MARQRLRDLEAPRGKDDEDRALDELRRDSGLPLSRFEADSALEQGKDFDVAELRRLFQEFLNQTDMGR